MDQLKAVQEALKEYDQDHLLQHYESLSAEDQEHLLADIKNIDFKHLREIQRAPIKRSFSSIAGQIDEAMQPIPKESFASVNRGNQKDKVDWENEGLRSISKGKVAVLVLAGGQGTRLGSKNPKGMFDVGIPSNKSLYQVNAEKIKRLQDLAFERTGNRGSIPWYIMTSEATMKSTKDFFESRNHFGLDSKNVVFFEQFTLPCTDFDGKVLLAQKHKIARAPDGNGGLYRALRDRKIIDDMIKRGIEIVHVHCVDNILQKTADPVFIGFCRSKGADCGAKVVEKTEPKESVGVVCKVDGVYQVVEYSEILPQTTEKRDKNGRLLYNAGNICNHYFRMDFLQQVCKSSSVLPHHVAKKKIPHVNERGDVIKPTSPNGIKWEKFVFDVFKFSKNFVVFEVSRDDEFSPLKNAEGAASSSPMQARWSLASLHHRQILDAGGVIVDENDTEIAPLINAEKHPGEYPIVVEISPLLSYDGENLESLVKGKRLRPPVILDGDKPQKSSTVA